MPEEISVLRRKLRKRDAAVAAAVPTPLELSLPRALARIAEGQMRLALKVTHLTDAPLLPVDLVAALEPGSLIAMLDGDAGAGLLVLGAGALQALIEVQTTGRVGVGAPSERNPTPTDAVIVAPFLDAVLGEISLSSGRLRLGRAVDDPRPLPLYLGEGALRVLRVTMDIGEGPVREGLMMIAFAEPAAASQAAEQVVSSLGAAAVPDAGWGACLEQSVMAAEASLDAVLARVSLPLDAVLRWAVGSEVPLPPGAIDRVRIEGQGGVPVVCGRLGQSRGNRAVRIIRDHADSAGALGGRVGDGAEKPLPSVARAEDALWQEAAAARASAVIVSAGEDTPAAALPTPQAL